MIGVRGIGSCTNGPRKRVAGGPYWDRLGGASRRADRVKFRGISRDYCSQSSETWQTGQSCAWAGDIDTLAPITRYRYRHTPSSFPPPVLGTHTPTHPHTHLHTNRHIHTHTHILILVLTNTSATAKLLVSSVQPNFNSCQ